MTAGNDASVDVIAVDERQAGIVFGIAARFISRNPDLAGRFRCIGIGWCIRLRGLRCGVCQEHRQRWRAETRTCVSVMKVAGCYPRRMKWRHLRQAKKLSTVLLIGTPGPRPDNVLARVRETALANPDDSTQVYREISAAGFESHSTDCEHCWEAANPALDDFLYRDALAALQPPKMTESHFRRTRLVQWVTDNDDRS